MNGRSAGNDARNVVLNDANVAALSAMPDEICLTSMKFLKAVAARAVNRVIVSPASVF